MFDMPALQKNYLSQKQATMGKHFFFGIVVTIFISKTSISQISQNLDSLLQNVKTAKADSNKIYTLNAIANQYTLAGNFDSVRVYALEAIQLSDILNYKKGKISAFLNLGIASYYQAEYPEAVKYYSEALKISEELGLKQGI